MFGGQTLGYKTALFLLSASFFFLSVSAQPRCISKNALFYQKKMMLFASKSDRQSCSKEYWIGM